MREVSAIFQQGGWVSYALVLVSVALWAGVWVRLNALRPAAIAAVLEAVGGPSSKAPPEPAHPARLPREVLLRQAEARLSAWRGLIHTLVVAAPLLGLLGTVEGMVELFDSLHGASTLRETSVAGGISTALITTQLGLVIGVPGLVASRLLDRRQARLELRLQHARGDVALGGTP